MDTPTLSPPEPPATAPAPTPVPAAPASPSPPHTSRSAQVALVAFLVLTLGLLAFRGYGAWLGARPTDARAPVDLNAAGRTDLEQVPGIGPAMAREIAADREKNGPFRSVEELRRVKGMGPVTFDKVRAFLRVEPSTAPPTPDLEPLVLERKPAAPAAPPYPRTGVKKIQPGDPPINVNVAPAEELMRLPAVGPVTAQNIIAARAARPFRTVADLDGVKGIGPKTLEKLRPFVVVE